MNRFPRAFWAGVVAGWAIIAFGVWGLFMDANQTNPASWVKWFLGGALVHDLVVVPVVLLVGTGVARVVPPRWLAPVQGALISSALVIATFAILVSGSGDISENPSALPNNYALGLALVLGFIWATALVWAVAHRDAVKRAPTRT